MIGTANQTSLGSEEVLERARDAWQSVALKWINPAHAGPQVFEGYEVFPCAMGPEVRQGYRIVFVTARTQASIPEADEAVSRGAIPAMLYRVDIDVPVEQDVLENTLYRLRHARREEVEQSLLELQEERREEGECAIDPISLRELADVLIEQSHYADPALTADYRGKAHAEWRIDGNGILVWGFLGARRSAGDYASRRRA